ncbi:DNA adenine methylase Dam [Clostridium aceticum]|uniref:DNA adenine methylase Dam n=1 Tax=Clostridium aceticum TaxID=84022 RepID=A0A0D8IFG7_9CLOT|nr:DNA adenine methylase [Clostridium aceticum]AKL95040.1 DNA adenine methylase Dam [Clostridium aceticum]KJF27931.1 DNA adenine methylase [Clostridium aceticum]
MLKSPLSWMGGKYRLRKKIIELIPEDHTCYIEVFGGAGWVFFGKQPSKVEVYNDINSELVNFFRVLKYHSEEFKAWIEKDVASREIFAAYHDALPQYMTDIQRAVKFFYLIKYSFASKGDNFGYGTSKDPNKAIFNTGFVQEVRDRLRNCYVENLSFETLIEKYDSQGSFFFCDPPYHKLAQYKDKFHREDHLKLLDMLKHIKGKFLVTINDHPEVREWYQEFNIQEVEVGYSVCREAKGRRSFKELIITNYSS